MCIHVLIHAYIYTHRHSYVLVYKHTYIFTCKYACTHQCMYGYQHKYTCLHTYTHVYLHIYACPPTCNHIYNICPHSCMYVCMHAYTHRCMCVDLYMYASYRHTDRHSYLLTNMNIYIQVIHFNLETNIILNLSICTIFRIAYFENFQTSAFSYFWKYGNLIILEMKKFCKYGY